MPEGTISIGIQTEADDCVKSLVLKETVPLSPPLYVYKGEELISLPCQLGEELRITVLGTEHVLKAAAGQLALNVRTFALFECYAPALLACVLTRNATCVLPLSLPLPPVPSFSSRAHVTVF